MAPDFTPLESSSKVASIATPEQQRLAVETALAVENPNLSKVDTVDCVTCHVVTIGREYAEKNNKSLANISTNRFASAQDLTRPGLKDLASNTLGAFRYFGAELVVQQRVVNETAAVVRLSMVAKVCGATP